jgi:hypothetical protein
MSDGASGVAAQRLLENDDERMRSVLERYGESPDLCDRAELWQVGPIEVLWLPDAHLAAVSSGGRLMWHRHADPQAAARCPYPKTGPDAEGHLCDGHWEELRGRAAPRS